MSYRGIALRHGVSKSQAHRICRGRRWMMEREFIRWPLSREPLIRREAVLSRMEIRTSEGIYGISISDSRAELFRRRVTALGFPYEVRRE